MIKNQIIDLIEKELKRHRDLLNHMDSRFLKLPEGSLESHCKNGETYYLRSIRKNGERIRIAITSNCKDDQRLISELKERSNILHARPRIRKNIKELENFLEGFTPYNPEELKYADNADSKLYLDGDICISEWTNARYERNPFRTEERIHKTKSGLYVRSKSEALIADILSDYNIPFRNDCKEMFGKITKYPDFHLIRSWDGRLFIWEHFGLIENPSYLINTFEKIELYSRYGYSPGINFIITWETKDNPLTRDRVIQVLEDNGFI